MKKIKHAFIITLLLNSLYSPIYSREIIDRDSYDGFTIYPDKNDHVPEYNENYTVKYERSSEMPLKFNDSPSEIWGITRSSSFNEENDWDNGFAIGEESSFSAPIKEENMFVLFFCILLYGGYVLFRKKKKQD